MVLSFPCDSSDFGPHAFEHCSSAFNAKKAFSDLGTKTKHDLRCKINLMVLNQSDFRIKECLHEEFGFSLVYYLS